MVGRVRHPEGKAGRRHLGRRSGNRHAPRRRRHRYLYERRNAIHLPIAEKPAASRHCSAGLEASRAPSRAGGSAATRPPASGAGVSTGRSTPSSSSVERARSDEDRKVAHSGSILGVDSARRGGRWRHLRLVHGRSGLAEMRWWTPMAIRTTKQTSSRAACSSSLGRRPKPESAETGRGLRWRSRNHG